MKNFFAVFCLPTCKRVREFCVCRFIRRPCKDRRCAVCYLLRRRLAVYYKRNRVFVKSNAFNRNYKRTRYFRNRIRVVRQRYGLSIYIYDYRRLIIRRINLNREGIAFAVRCRCLALYCITLAVRKFYFVRFRRPNCNEFKVAFNRRIEIVFFAIKLPFNEVVTVFNRHFFRNNDELAAVHGLRSNHRAAVRIKRNLVFHDRVGLRGVTP